MKRLPIVFIITGLLITCIPITGQVYVSYKQKKLMEQWEEGLKEYKEVEKNNKRGNYRNCIEESYMDLQEIFTAPPQPTLPNKKGQHLEAALERPTEEIESIEDKSQRENTDASRSKSNIKPPKEILGILKMSKINVEVPIVEGIKKEDLRIGVGHIPGTAGIGETGNCAIAGHRSYTFGKFFNRLDEIEIGDEIIVSVKENKYTYTVYKKHIIEPNDLSILKPDGDSRILTLITCHPIYIASHRLIVHAKAESLEKSKHFHEAEGNNIQRAASK